MSSYQDKLIQPQQSNNDAKNASRGDALGLDPDGVMDVPSPQPVPAIGYAETLTTYPIGLHVLYDPMLGEKKPVHDGSQRLDIIAIHGLHGSWDTWRSSTTGFSWITDLLPNELPFARVLAFGYSDTPDNAADALLAELVDDRARNKDNKGNKIILLGHSFGGYVAKRFFLSTHRFMNQQHAVLEIHSSIKGFVFLGVDHDNVAVDLMIRSLPLLGPITRSAPSNWRGLFLAEFLEEWRAQIPYINHRFASWGGEQLATACFWETQPTTVNVATRDIRILVPKEVAMLGLPWVENLPLNRNHLNLVRYDSRDQGCRIIVETIAGLLRERPALPPPPLEHVEAALAEERGLRILSLDGGGIRGLFSVIVLEAIMERVREYDFPNRPDALKPCDYFDLIGGTSTGGLLAVMLGRLRMDLSSCRSAYQNLSRQIFRRHYLQNRAVNAAYAFFHRPWFSGEALKAAIQGVVSQGLSYQETTALSLSHVTTAEAPFRQLQDTNCRTLVCAVREGSNCVERLRTYDSSATGAATPCKIWEACRATSAAPLFFPNITVNGIKYWDGGLLSNNPIIEVYNEAATEFPRQQFDAIVSIGTGRQAHANPPSSLFGILSWAVQQLVRTEQNHAQFATLASQRHGQDVYERLNGGADLWELGMDDWQKLERVQELAVAFIHSEEGRRKIDGCARRIARQR